MATVRSFSDLKLNSWIVRQLQSLGLTKPTPIQESCIPAILQGQNCIGSAKTGSGKTLAFALPILQRLCEDPYGIFALVLTPTRELAFQIADQFSVVGKTINLRLCVVVGGMDMVTQGQELARKPHIVVATPGRLADHLESCNTFTLKKLQFVVFDEADRLFSGQFSEQLETIFAALPVKKQVLLFSATITDDLKNAKELGENEFFTWDCRDDVATVEQLDQFYVLCPFDVRDSYLVETIRTFRQKSENGSIMIFTDTCKNCQLLSMTLNEVGFDNVALHSMMPQKQRLAALTQFKSDVIRILIATDVASRGLDISAVELVLNHTVPSNPKDYIHRVGRTARAGRGGTAVSLVTPYDIRLVHAIEEVINTKLKEYKVDDKEVANIMTQVSVTKGEAEITLDENNFYERKLINKRKKLILEGKDPDEEEESKRKYLKEKYRKRRKRDKEAENTRLRVTEEEAETKFDDTKFDERKLVNNEKKIISEGKNLGYTQENKKYFKGKLKKRRKKDSVADNSN